LQSENERRFNDVKQLPQHQRNTARASKQTKPMNAGHLELDHVLNNHVVDYHFPVNNFSAPHVN
jgi:hypothetical protein